MFIFQSRYEPLDGQLMLKPVKYDIYFAITKKAAEVVSAALVTRRVFSLLLCFPEFHHDST
jgi:hypothetical protein